MIPSFKDFQTTRSTTVTPSAPTTVPSFKSFVQTRQTEEPTRLIPPAPTPKKQEPGLFMKYFPKQAQATEKYITDSVTQAKGFFEKSKHPLEFWKDYYNPKPFIEPAVESWNKAKSAVDNMVQDYQKGTGSTAGDVANLATLASGVAGVLFSPITGVFNKASEIPGLKQAADAFNVPFTVAGMAGAYTSGKVVDVLPISQQSKDVLREPIKEIGSLFGQVLLGGKMMEKAGGYLKKGKEITPEIANKIVAESKAELLKTKPELVALKVETPTTGVSFKDWVEQGKPKLLERPAEPLLLTEGVKPTEIQGQGFTMKDKASKYELDRGKAINAYQEALTKYNEKPTVTGRLKVQRLKEVRDTYLTQPKPVVPTTPEIAPVLAGERVPTITTPEATLAQTKLAEVKPTQGPTVSGVAKQIEAKAIEQGLTSKGFNELAEYDASTIKKQAEIGAKYTIEQLKEISKTGNLPEGMKPGTALSILEDFATKNKDLGLLTELAKSPLVAKLSESASELSLSRMREKGGVVESIREVYENRKKAVQDSVRGETVKLKEAIKKSKPTKDAWLDFVESIKC